LEFVAASSVSSNRAAVDVGPNLKLSLALFLDRFNRSPRRHPKEHSNEGFLFAPKRQPVCI
jgi:hypothetical protein